jgi:Holliday junction resolvase-like predicted endonuclease
MEEKKRTKVSYSQYSVGETCPLQWRLKYLDGYREPSNGNLIFGTAVHEAIQAWLQVYYNKKPALAATFDIHGVFKDALIAEFKKVQDEYKVNPCDQATLMEFYEDGVAILNAIKKYKKDIFPLAGYELVGCEIELEQDITNDIYFVGYIDIVIRQKKTGKIIIIDLKTSTRGWSDKYEKKDPKKLNQLLLYKRYYAEQLNIAPDDITVQFVILKRKLADSPWAKRIAIFEPPQGKDAMTKAYTSFLDFVNRTYDAQGNPRVNHLTPTPSASNCKFCFFKNKPELCGDSYYG